MRNDGFMRQTFAQGKKASVAKLLDLRRGAQRDIVPRLLLCVQGILMSLDGHTIGEIAAHLNVHRSTVPLWIDQRTVRHDIMNSGPVVNGLETGISTSPLVGHFIPSVNGTYDFAGAYGEEHYDTCGTCKHRGVTLHRLEITRQYPEGIYRAICG
jgi:hypothetical protein